MSPTFVNEAECYQLFERYGLNTPRHMFIDSIAALNSVPFSEGDEVVYKAVVDDVWHKSDLELISFGTFSIENVALNFERMHSLNPRKECWQGLLICEKIKGIKRSLPCDLLLSVKQDASCGPVVTLGFGGVHTELWGSALKEGVLNYPLQLISADEAMVRLSDHLIGKILLGNVRNGRACVTPKSLKDLLASIWKLAANLHAEGLSLIEINPLLINSDGHFIALDGVGEKEGSASSKDHIQPLQLSADVQKALLNPQTFLIAGVSAKKKAFGNIILDNLKTSELRKENITVLKPGNKGIEFDGFHTIDTLEDLKQPVDALVLAVPAIDAIALIKETFQLNKAKVIHLVAGGIGDGADHLGFKEQLTSIINSYPQQNRPYIVGPNSLGMLLAPQKLNTLFIPHEKLPLSFYPHGNIGLVAQSGAFFITRLSKNPLLAIRYGLCIGNQLDISATDIVTTLAADPQVDIIGLYLEGAPQGNALALAKAIKNIVGSKKVIIYRAGRSPAGMKAAAGHTGALATEYSIEKNLLQLAGAIICEDFNHFENCLRWYSIYPDFKRVEQGVSVISNAGYESVAAADGLRDSLTILTEDTQNKLTEMLQQHRLATIVTASNPLDITPMASDEVYYECSQIMLQADESRMLILGLVPLTVMIETNDEEVIKKNVLRLKTLSLETKKPIALVIDAGNHYLKIKEIFIENGLVVFPSIQDLFKIII